MTAHSQASAPRHPSRRLACGCALAVSALLFLAIAGSSAAAEETHFFDATLSLTGDCTTNLLDSVADPGLCPMPPGVAGVDHPTASISFPRSVTTDEYGNLYVVSGGSEGPGGPAHGTDARIDIFDPSGHYLNDIPLVGAAAVAVDAEGHLYVFDESAEERPSRLLRFDPTTYNPAASEIEYANPPIVLQEGGKNGSKIFFWHGIAVDSDGHLYVTFENRIAEYGSAAEGNELLTTIGEGVLSESRWVAIDRGNGNIYATHTLVVPPGTPSRSAIKVFDGEDPKHPLIRTIDGSTTPAGEFTTGSGLNSVAVDASTHHVFVDDRRAETPNKPVYELTETGEYVSTIEHNFAYVLASQIAIDNGAHSPNSGFARGPNGGYLFVPSGASVHAHLYAFQPKPVPKAPKVEAVSFRGVTEDEAELRAKINPEGVQTHYAIQYTTQQRYDEEGFVGALLAGEANLAPSAEGKEVSAPVSGLTPGESYRFRAVAENECEAGGCTGEREGSFTTFVTPPPAPACPNAALRAGPSAALPDCRAYELVTPVNTNGRSPLTIGAGFSGQWFGMPTASPDGARLNFRIEGGSIPGFEAAGGPYGDVYLASRSASGWLTESASPNGAQSAAPQSGGTSADQLYHVWTSCCGVGSLEVEGDSANYLRYPDGSFQLIGQGSIGAEPKARPMALADGGAHLILDSAVQLEPDAPPSGTRAIYDRGADGALRVVSLLPEDLTPAAGQHASHLGASADLSAVAFKLGDVASSPIYLRVNNAKTLVADPGPEGTFAGLSADGRYLFYLSGGDLFRFDASSEETAQVTASGDATVVNVPAAGTSAYFASPSVLTEEANPLGEQAEEGEENLYFWDGAVTRFIATLTATDLAGEKLANGIQHDGLGFWVPSLSLGFLGRDPSQSTAGGQTLLFESRAAIGDYESAGKAEIYRYQAAEGTLLCLSCDPTQAPAGANTTLTAMGGADGAASPISQYSLVSNLSPDGRRAFFQSPERLVLKDTDNLQDVYEWEEQGVGSCSQQGGCLYLISTGRNARDSYLFGASRSGDDVFIASSDLLAGGDTDETPSIYDARVNGGFAPPFSTAAECLGEACQPAATAPDDPTPAS